MPVAAKAIGERIRGGDRRALARAISLVERRDPCVPELLEAASAGTRGRPTVGITGAPGAGKSTLVDALIARAREAGKTVGVIAVDPSSPFTGGALLGDRVRMHRHVLDAGVFVRSMGARGQSGGLAAATDAAILLMAGFGFDEILVETVGVGQSDHTVTQVVDTSVLVLSPGAGDLIQLQKAGIMEAADVFVVNKSDLDGAATFLRDLRRVVGGVGSDGWAAPALGTVANQPDDSQLALWEAIETHRRNLAESEVGKERIAGRRRAQVAELIAGAAREWALAELESDPALNEQLELSGAPLPVAIQLAAQKDFAL